MSVSASVSALFYVCLYFGKLLNFIPNSLGYFYQIQRGRLSRKQGLVVRFSFNAIYGGVATLSGKGCVGDQSCVLERESESLFSGDFELEKFGSFHVFFSVHM